MATVFATPQFLALTNAPGTTPEIFNDGNIAISFPAVYASTTLTFYGYDTTQGYIALYTSANAAVTQTIAAARCYNLTTEIANHRRIKIVTNSATDKATVTFANATDAVVWASHGLSANAPVHFSGGTSPAALTFPGVYYVKTVIDANNFTLSATAGGTVINLTDDGAATVTAVRAVEILQKG